MGLSQLKKLKNIYRFEQTYLSSRFYSAFRVLSRINSSQDKNKSER